MSFLQVKLLDPKAIAPTVAHPGEDLAYDLYASKSKILWPFGINKVSTSIAAAAHKEIKLVDEERYLVSTFAPLGLIIKDRSSMAAQGVFTHAGVIDPGYRGEIKVIMTRNLFSKRWRIRAKEKIAQMVPVEVHTGEVIVTHKLPEALRGEKGFGSSGR